jgi:hypothetical protein
MVILGILSILQLSLIPGWIVTSFWKHPSWLSRCLISFTISLLINYWLVIILIALNVFNHQVVLGILVAELIIIAIIWWRNFRLGNTKSELVIDLPAVSIGEISAPSWIRKSLTMAIVLGFVAAVITILVQVMTHNPGVFNIWDDFVSFNRWALQWYQSKMPTDNQFYPQLFPVNWALGYKILGRDDIQFFVKAVMGLFPLAILAIFTDLWLRFRKLVWLVGGIFTTTWLLAISNNFIGSGYVDIPLAFMALLAYTMIILVKPDKLMNWSSIVAVSLVLSSAALTKQGGIFVVIIALFVWLVVALWHKPIWQVVGRVGLGLAIVGLLSLSWYGYRLYQVKVGVSDSEFAGIEAALERSVGKSASFSKKLTRATVSVDLLVAAQTLHPWRLLPTSENSASAVNTNLSNLLVNAIMLGWSLLLIWGIFDPKSRYALITIVAPFYLIWVNWYSYDFRNMVLIVPFIGLAASFGIIKIINGIFHQLGLSTRSKEEDESLFSKWQWRYGSVYLLSGMWLLSILFTLVLQWQYPLAKLQALHLQKMSGVGIPIFNQKLYSYYRNYGLTGKIRTMYLPMAYLPELKDYALASGDTLTLDALKKYEQDPEVHYVFWWSKSMASDVIDYINQQVGNKKYAGIFSENNYHFFKIK